MEWRFEEPVPSHLFNTLVQILDVNIWIKSQEQLYTFCDIEIGTLDMTLKDFFDLNQNQCFIPSVFYVGDSLKAFILSMITDIFSINYLEIRSKIILNKELQARCGNDLHRASFNHTFCHCKTLIKSSWPGATRNVTENGWRNPRNWWVGSRRIYELLVWRKVEKDQRSKVS